MGTRRKVPNELASRYLDPSALGVRARGALELAVVSCEAHPVLVAALLGHGEGHRVVGLLGGHLGGLVGVALHRAVAVDRDVVRADVGVHLGGHVLDVVLLGRRIVFRVDDGRHGIDVQDLGWLAVVRLRGDGHEGCPLHGDGLDGRVAGGLLGVDDAGVGREADEDDDGREDRERGGLDEVGEATHLLVGRGEVGHAGGLFHDEELLEVRECYGSWLPSKPQPSALTYS